MGCKWWSDVITSWGPDGATRLSSACRNPDSNDATVPTKAPIYGSGKWQKGLNIGTWDGMALKGLVVVMLVVQWCWWWWRCYWWQCWSNNAHGWCGIIKVMMVLVTVGLGGRVLWEGLMSNLAMRIATISSNTGLNILGAHSRGGLSVAWDLFTEEGLM